MAMSRLGSVNLESPDDVDFQDLTEQLDEYEKAIDEKIEVMQMGKSGNCFMEVYEKLGLNERQW